MWTFVDAFGLKKSASFEHVRYGEVAGSKLCDIWKKRILQLYDAWVLAESPPSFASIVVPDYELSDDDSRALTDMSARVEA
eukprot:2088020-Amphidinium_carterae.1